MTKIAPSVLGADFGRLAQEIQDADKAGADLFHLDIMDGHFVPNISFGPAIVKTINEVTDKFLDVHLMLVGEGEEQLKLNRAITSLGLSEHVSMIGWIPPEEFPQIPAAADLGIVLRTPSAGETSAAAVRFLACSTPVAVSGVHQFLEWPESAAPRITPGPSSNWA